MPKGYIRNRKRKWDFSTSVTSSQWLAKTRFFIIFKIGYQIRFMKDLENNGIAGPCAEVLQKDVEVLDTKAASG